jgi:UDP-N-acetylglucosamine:LPS N-acetylglucosamine transferase
MCDLVVTKCGYSTVSEAVQAQIPLMVWKREGFIEDDIIAGTLEKEGLGVTIDYPDINSGSWLKNLPELRKKTDRFDLPAPHYKNETNAIAEGIMEFIL